MYRDNGYSGRASRIGVVVTCDAELSGQDRESLSHMMPVTITYPGTGSEHLTLTNSKHPTSLSLNGLKSSPTRRMKG